MLISHSKKFIFIHNYKVAGTSIKSGLISNEDGLLFTGKIINSVKSILGVYPKIYSSRYPEHIKASELKKDLPKEIFDNYYKFGFVRNPWDWQVSLYTYTLQQPTHYQYDLIKSMKSFDEYIDWRVKEDLQLQKDFFYESGVSLMNYIGKFENLENDFAIISTQIGIKPMTPHLNVSRVGSEGYLKFYSQRSIDIVFEAFNEDIKLFGYDKPELQNHI